MTKKSFKNNQNSETNINIKKNKPGKTDILKAKQKKLPDVIRINVNTKGINPRRNDFQNSRISNQEKPKFPGKTPIDKKLLEKYKRGDGIQNFQNIKTQFHKEKIKKREKSYEWSAKQATRAELLLTEDSGVLEADPGETTTQFTQKEIMSNVDITAASKSFELHLNDFGPYRMKYSRNGRHLLLGGNLGHIAAFDWVTKKLHCEMNVMESVHDVQWLHVETMFAVAQKKWLYIYDHQGIEIHCVKKLNKVLRMEFLPYHFLLATASEEGYLSWLDISLGELVSQYNTKLGRLSLLAQNPYNALLCLGHSKGVVSMWSPNVREPLAKMLCHKAAMSGIAVDPKGLYMATSGIDRSLKIWDIRKLNGPIQTYKTRSAATNLSFSQKNLLATGMGNIVEVYRNCCTETAKGAYLRHQVDSTISNMMYCSYEDVLGVATARGFASLIVPGAGEPNYDALEVNPYQTKSQRREAEVKSLLEKIQPELITLDPTVITEVDVPTLRNKIEAKKQLLYLKPPNLNYTPRKKANRYGGSVKIFKNKKIVKETHKKEFLKNVSKLESTHQDNKKTKPKSVLDRFREKKQLKNRK